MKNQLHFFIKPLLLITFCMSMSLSYKLHAQYCIPEYITGTADNDYIDGVILEDINNTGTGGAITSVGYSDYTYLSTDLTTGENYTLELHNTDTWGETYAAWVDYNQDEEFTDEEKLGEIFIDAGDNDEMDFIVPLSALAGETRLRVVCAYFPPSPPVDPCPVDYYFGETEDYTINVISGAPCEISVPIDLATSDITSVSAILSWTDPATADLYKVRIRIHGVYDSIYYITTPTTPLLVGDLLPGTHYSFKVRELCTATGEISSWSAPDNFYTPFRIGELKDILSIYPNPSDGNFSIQLTGIKNENISVTIISADGKIIFENNIILSGELHTENIQLTNIAKGIYFVRSITNGIVNTYPLVIEK